MGRVQSPIVDCVMGSRPRLGVSFLLAGRHGTEEGPIGRQDGMGPTLFWVQALGTS
jgi:hypothetical protein